MDLDEAVEVEGVRLVEEGGEPLVGQRGDDQQDRVGAVDRRLEQLVAVDDEVLLDDRQLRRGPGGAEVVVAAVEVGLVGEDRQGGGASLLVGA